MIQLILGRGDSPRAVSLYLPNTSAEIEKTFAALDHISTESPTVVAEFNSSVDGLSQYVKSVNLDNKEDFAKLNALAEKVSTMNAKESWIFSGALAANSINGIDDVLKVADHLDDYMIVPNVNTDAELGRFIATIAPINGDPRFPEESWPYLDFAKIGAEYYADHGGAYTYGGYVLRTPSSQREMRKDGAIMSLQLETSERACISQRNAYPSRMPMTWHYLSTR